MPQRTLITTRARSLRQAMSSPEVMLWSRLRGRGADKPTFRRQHPMGSIILDFGAVAQAILDRAREMRAGR